MSSGHTRREGNALSSIAYIVDTFKPSRKFFLWLWSQAVAMENENAGRMRAS